MSRRRPFALGGSIALALALALAAAPAARAADEVVSAGDVVEADSLAAAGGAQVWLRWDGRRYRLVQRVRGAVADAPVPPFPPVRDGGADDRGLPGAEDVPDLGTDRAGRLVAVYSRCSGRGGRRDCDVYSYRVGTAGPERRLGYASSSACRERTPSIWRGVVVLTRGRRTDRCRTGLWVVRPSGRARRLRPPRPGIGPDRVFVEGTDVRGGAVLVSLVGVTSEAEATGYDTAIALLRTSGGRARTLATGFSADNAEPGETLSDVASPQLDGRHAYWTRRCHRALEDGDFATTGDLVRLDLRARGARPARMEPRAELPVAAFAVDGRRVFYAFAGAEGGVRRASDPPREFSALPCSGGA